MELVLCVVVLCVGGNLYVINYYNVICISIVIYYSLVGPGVE
jgi:hypothetical protein